VKAEAALSLAKRLDLPGPEVLAGHIRVVMEGELTDLQAEVS
jgi:hypothetical protein